jgi:glucoamylase
MGATVQRPRESRWQKQHPQESSRDSYSPAVPIVSPPNLVNPVLRARDLVEKWVRVCDPKLHVLLGAGTLLATCAAAAWAWRKLSPELEVAPGFPGHTPHWTSSAKQGVGTSLGPQSNVWFTLHHGIVTEVFYPRADQPAIAQMELVVIAGDGFYSEEKLDADYQVEYPHDGVPLYRLTNTCRKGRYRIEKTVFAHPTVPAVIQRTRFVPLVGSLDDYRLHVLVDPHMGNRGWRNTGWVGRYENQILLFAEEDDHNLALGASVPWKNASAGFTGVSDGRRQLKKYGRLKQTYRRAPRGNVGLAAEIDLGYNDGDFTLALGFGAAAHEAGLSVRRTLLADLDAVEDEYVRRWRNWQSQLTVFGDATQCERDLYRASTMVLRTHEDKAVPGAFVASLSIPWGEARKTDEHVGPVGYHVVWPRDLFMIAGGLLASGENEAPLRALEYCQATQLSTGGWPQNQAVNGEARWTGHQLGQTSLPIHLLNLVNREGLLSAADRRRYWPMVGDALGHIIRRGPSAEEDRWEDAHGFTPFSLSDMISALVVGADLAEEQHEHDLSTFLMETADAWHGDIDYWTYVEDTPLAHEVGVPGYYLRIAPPNDRGEPTKYHGGSELWYRPPSDKHCPPARIVSADALAYVRFGLRAPNDPRIVNTLKVIDAVLKRETPYGPAWYRYNRDGYGEKQDGAPFDNQRGVGRLWPLLTGERAHYELLAGNREEAWRLLAAMERFAGQGKLLPEQVWDTNDIPARDLYFGRPSGSAMPLAWAHAEYLKLRRSLAEGRVFDLPPQSWQRYVIDRIESRLVIWRPNHRRRIVPPGNVLRVMLDEPATIIVDDGEGRTRSLRTRAVAIGVHYADLPTDNLRSGETLRFCFDRPLRKWLSLTGWFTVRCDHGKVARDAPAPHALGNLP